MTDRKVVEIKVNGRKYSADCEVRLTLADFIRHEIGLTGTHLGCEHGVCGACTVLLNGRSVRSCLLLAVQADGAELMTVEGLADGEELSLLQTAFWDNHGLQCGFCTSGMLITAWELLQEKQDFTEAEVRERISGNLCRCTGYQSIVDSILDAAERMRTAGVSKTG